jgi:hypothetical protein
MEFALLLRELSRRRLLLAAGVLLAAIAATLSVYRLDGLKLKARSLQYSSASTQLLVDTPSSVLGNLSQSFEPLSARAVVYANFMASPAVLQLIGQQVGLSGEQIYAAGPVNAQQPRVVQEPTALKRNVQIAGETNPYRLSFESQANLPTINIFAQAPTTMQAIALANGAVAGLQRYVTSLENANKIPAPGRVTIRQLGPANGAVVNGGISKALAAIVFIVVFLMWCVLLLAGSRFLQSWRASASPHAGNDQAGTREAGRRAVEDPVSIRDEGTPAAESSPPPPSVGRDDDRMPAPTRSAR